MPGLMTLPAFLVVIHIRVRSNPSVAPAFTGMVTGPEKWHAAREAWPVAALFVIIVGALP